MFPTEETITTGQESYSYTDIDGSTKIGTNTMFGTAKHLGISKRLFIATMAMQGIISMTHNQQLPNGVAERAFEYADALLERENRGELIE